MPNDALALSSHSQDMTGRVHVVVEEHCDIGEIVLATNLDCLSR